MDGTGNLQDDAAEPPPIEEPPETTFAAVDGLATERARLREAVITPATDSRLDGLGASGVLLHGPAGVGKSHLARAVIGELGVPFLELTPGTIPLADGDRAASRIAAIRDRALEAAPCVVLAEDLSVLAPADPGSFEERDVSRQVVAAFRRALDAFDEADAPVVFLATSISLKDVEQRVRRQGRIDLRIGLERPDESRRAAVLERELRAVESRGTTVDVDPDAIDAVVDRTQGATVAELVEVVERAARRAVDEGGPVDGDVLVETATELDAGTGDEDGDGKDDEDGFDLDIFGSEDKGSDEENGDEESDDRDRERDVTLDREGFRGSIDPRQAIPDVGFDDVGGLAEQKRRLRELIEWPQRYPDRFEALDIDTSRGVILHGPPGTGKTLLAKAIASETERAFLSVSGPELLDMYVGESERLVRDLFDVARELAPTVLFFDEFDTIAGRRGDYTGTAPGMDSIVNQLLSELDGMDGLEDVVVLAATNRLETIDPAIRRPGRFGEAVEVPPPGPEGRREVFAVHLADRVVAGAVDMRELAARTRDGYTGADIAEICDRAAMAALRDDVDGTPDETDDEATVAIRPAHFDRAIESVDPTCGEPDADGGDRTFQ